MKKGTEVTSVPGGKIATKALRPEGYTKDLNSGKLFSSTNSPVRVCFVILRAFESLWQGIWI